MKAETVYLKAAAKLANDPESCSGWSCWAIEDVLAVERHNADDADLVKHDLVRQYESLFKPRHLSGGSWGFYWGDTTAETNECRILALCFMAAICSR